MAIAIIDKTEGLQVLRQSETEGTEDFISKVMRLDLLHIIPLVELVFLY